ncbi:unnamed protein product, partial [Ectocarpus sp. 4 AP-2014]
LSALFRAATWVLPLVLADVAAAAAAAPTGPSVETSRLFGAETHHRHHRRQKPSPTSPRGGGRTFSPTNGGGNGNGIASSRNKREVAIRRRSNGQQRRSSGWLGWASDARQHARKHRLSGDSPAGFIASPTAALGQQRRGARTCGSSSGGYSPLRSFGGGTEAGVQRDGWVRTKRPGRQQRQPVPWGGGRGSGGRRPSPGVVILGGGTGDTEYYSWTETDSDMEVRVPLPPGTAAKSVQLSVTKTSLTLGLQGREGPVLKGSLKGQVHADESHWTMEEMEDTGEKVLYLCLEKVADMEALAANSMPQDWVGVLEGEEPLNVYYPDKDKDFDVGEYVKRMGYDRERDIGKVDKAMFSDLTAEMKENLQTTLPKSSFTDKDDMIPVMADPKVSPVIDTGVLGLPTPPPREPEVVSDATANANADGTVSSGGGTVSSDGDGAAAVDAEVVREGSWEAGFAPDLGGAAAGDGSDDSAYSPAGFRADADFNVPIKDGETGDLTERQREVAAGLRRTYEKLVKTGMVQETNPDGTPAKMPDMEEMARAYETEGFMFKEGDFSEEELSKYMDMDMGMGMAGLALDDDLPGGDIDLDDPATRSAFGLD